MRHLVLLAPCKSSDLDSIPTSLVKDCIAVLFCAFYTAIWLLLLCALSSPSLSLSWRDLGFHINHPASILVSLRQHARYIRYPCTIFAINPISFIFIATEKYGHYPGSSWILTFPCSFYLLEMWILILALVYVASVLEPLIPIPGGRRNSIGPLHQQRPWPPRHHWNLADHK